ncbi:Uncharacterised protein [Enterobacter cloacae]|uniref:hypothetical protein n=1 Tax=Enterobacter cloacae TaxID=550 RepID=UPI000797A30C|nr:hypothetical protein [Enterobacter cloacae]CZV23545.1 Uncharacterised protein [Enterobacter cloacae]HAS0907260.1 hypothetical protein [Enterobacter cloacae]
MKPSYEELEARCAALAAENAALKKYICDECYVENIKTGATKCAGLGMPETPATDAFLAEVRAQGVEMFVQWCRGERDFTLIDEDMSDAEAYEECVKRAEYFAAQLLQECAK